MIEALSKERLGTVYASVAGHYDWQHTLLTARADNRGRRLIVEHCVHPGDQILDSGAGTGSTALLAARATGAEGHVTCFDLSPDMLEIARQKAAAAELSDLFDFDTGDMESLPYADDRFDVVLSSYSLCPLTDPSRGATELLRVVRPGGLVGVAHSALPRNRLVRWLAEGVEHFVWRYDWLSMGCRAVNVLPALQEAGAELVFSRQLGVPLWPFLVFVLRKPEPS